MFRTRRTILQVGLSLFLFIGAANAQPHWALVAVDGPAPRSNHAMVYDSCRNVVVMYGGFDEQQGFEDTWEWDGTSWSLRASGGGPGVRFTHSMAFDATRCRTVLFGGNAPYNAPSYFNDTWEWDGNAWTQKCANCAPTVRHAPGMAYHALRQRVLLFGGWSGGSLLNDVWAWDGSTWTSITTNSGPTPRTETAMVYDPLQDRMVVFGGRTVPVLCGTLSNETWELELPTPSGPGTWTLQTVSTSPSPRTMMGMAFDASTGETLLYGGSNNCDTAYHDTWSYDGSSWQLLQGQTGPGNLYWFGMAFDNVRAETVLFGGNTADNRAIPPAAEHFRRATWSFGNRAYSIPTVGTWGLAAMTLLLLCVGTVTAMRRGRSLKETPQP